MHWENRGPQVPEGGNMLIGLLTLLALPLARYALPLLRPL